MIAFVREAAAATESLQAAVAAGEFERVGRWWAWLQQRAPIVGGVSLAEVAGDLGRRLGAFAAESAAALLRNVGGVLFDLVIVIFATFFLFRDARAIMALVRRVLPFEEEQRELVIRQAHDLIRASVVSSIAVASAQGTAGGLLFWAIGIGAPVFWGVVMTFFSLLPIGAWAIWLPAGVWLLVNGSTAKGLILLGVGAGVVSVIDNVLRPALLSGRAQMNGLLVLISLLGGIAAFGLIGVVVGPVIVATMASLLSAYTAPGSPRAARAVAERGRDDVGTQPSRRRAMSEHRLDRREFIRQSATAIGAALVAPVAAAAAPPRRATDLVPLGQTGVRMARLGIGTGSNGGDVQRGLGQEAFTRLLRHAVDHGVTYIDTADNYRIHEMVGAAIKGLPRERLFIQTKMPWDRPPFPDKPREALDRYRRELGVEYIDSLLLHCAVEHTWPPTCAA